MENPKSGARLPLLYSLVFLLAAGLSILMLITDKNLQTNFGSLSTGYYYHWYVVLGMAVVDLVGAGLLLAYRSRWMVKLGVVGSGAFAVVLLAVILTYSQVGFSSAMSFAQYLFGITYYGGDLRYLYDILLATYIGGFVVGVVSLALTRTAHASTVPAGGRSLTTN